MDPITIAAAISLAAKYVPQIVEHFAGKNAGAVAGKVAEIAQAVTGQPTLDAAAKAIEADPNLAMQFKAKILDNQVDLAKIAAQREKDAADADNEADKILTARIAELEGTASDLKALPYAGPLMLFLRGSQRIVIGYGTAWLDYLWLTGALAAPNEMQQRLLFTASLLVFVVLFGERAIKNVAPVIADIFAARAGIAR